MQELYCHAQSCVLADTHAHAKEVADTTALPASQNASSLQSAEFEPRNLQANSQRSIHKVRLLDSTKKCINTASNMMQFAALHCCKLSAYTKSIVFTPHFDGTLQDGGQPGIVVANDWHRQALTLALPQSSCQWVVALAKSLWCSCCTIGAQNILQALLVSCHFYRQGSLLSKSQLVQHICLQGSNAFEADLHEQASIRNDCLHCMYQAPTVPFTSQRCHCQMKLLT